MLNDFKQITAITFTYNLEKQTYVCTKKYQAVYNKITLYEYLYQIAIPKW